MSFEVYVPTNVRSKVGLGKAHVSSNGQIQIHPGDLAKVGIKRECVVLIDTATRRVGLRAPKEAEDGLREPTMMVALNKSATLARFSIKGALTACGVSTEEAQRHMTTLVSVEHHLITLSFGGIEGIAGTKKRGR